MIFLECYDKCEQQDDAVVYKRRKGWCKRLAATGRGDQDIVSARKSSDTPI